MPLISSQHRYSETEYTLQPVHGGWRIYAGWWGFDRRGEKDYFTGPYSSLITDEAVARKALAELQGAN